MAMSPIRLSVIIRIEAFLNATGMSADKLGRVALGDHKFYPRLRDGKNVTMGRVESILEFIAVETNKAA